VSGLGTPRVGAGKLAGELACKHLADLSRHTLIPPRGYTIGGLSGSTAAWIDGFSLIITR
jgi:hypothetical protein